jgi:hypothetical protein
MDTTHDRTPRTALDWHPDGQGRVQAKKADLASSAGAGVLGGGLGLLIASRLDDANATAVALITVGALLHGWGMLERHRRDAAAPQVWWAKALYWTCWGILAIVGSLVVVRL